MEFLFYLTMCIAGAVAGVTTGLFGIGGGFIVVPALLLTLPWFSAEEASLIYVAIGTSLASIIVSSLRAVQAHHARGAVDFAVLRDWAPWLVAGVCVGLYLASLTDGKQLLLVFAIGVLLYSSYFLLPGLFANFGTSLQMPTGFARAGLASALGGFSALLGIGGGTITVVTMVMCNRPVHQAVGTAAGVGFIIALPGTAGFLIMGLNATALPQGSIGYINMPALLAIALMSVFTAPLGARLAHRLNEAHLKRLFGGYLLLVSLTMFYKSGVFPVTA